MQRICEWCGQDLGKLEAETDIEYIINRGICDDCAFLLLLVADGNGSIKTANKVVQDLLQKNLHGIEGYLGSLVFECIH